MSTTTQASPRLATTPQAPMWALARVEAGRMLRSPAPWIGIALWAASNAFTLTSAPGWVSSQYMELTTSATFLALGVSIAVAYAFGRERTNVSEEASMPADQRAAGRLLGGLSLVALVAVVVAAGAAWLRLRGGLPLGAEPGRTLHAHFSLPELLQPVLVAAFAVALGAAVVHLARHPLTASIVLFVFWFIAGPAYWTINGPVLRWLTPVQVQPISVEAAPATTDPLTLPATWLLEGPGPFQDHWARLLVLPELAAWHDLYLVALTLLTAAVALPGRYRRPLLVVGTVLAIVAIALQRSVTP
ncbi:hypothetical protein GCM10023168_28600 [Fodinibacter luteus]|uniref:ABC transporter permease n=1 Tax=Fodinibacter luteus TaxID=552064 RepID=A0ABP8KMF6_9MICO